MIFGVRKLESWGYACGVICVILRLAVLILIPECDRHTHTQRDTQTHDDGYTALSIASRGKNVPIAIVVILNQANH